MSRPLTVRAVRYAGLAKADERKTISFVSFGFGLAELLWGKSLDLDDLYELGKSCVRRIELATVMMRKKGIIKDDAVVRVIRATPASTFSAQRAMREHTGMRAENIHSMVRALSK